MTSREISRAVAIALLAVAGAGSCTDPAAPASPPGVPQNVTVTLTGPSTARVSWSASSAGAEAKTFTVYRDDIKLGDSPTTSYDDNTLRELATYRYTVTATSSDGLISAKSPDSPAATITAPDGTSPTVTSVNPANGASGTSLAATAVVVFSEPPDPSTVNSTTISLRSATAVVPATIVYSSSTHSAEIKPTSALPNASQIQGSITTGVKDVARNTLASAFNWSFATRDELPPTVVSTSPVNGAAGVSASTIVTATFSEPMDPLTISATTFSLSESGGATIAGTVTYDSPSRTASFTPLSALRKGVSQTVTIGAGATDVAGNHIAAPFAFSFVTLAPPPPSDTIPPTIVAITPAAGAVNVPVAAKVVVAFSEAMDVASINSSTVSVRNVSSGTAVVGSVAYNAATRSATFTPSTALSNLTPYSATVSTGVRDASGNALASLASWSFTTEPAPQPPPPPPTDTVPPTIVARTPASGATGVSIAARVIVTFSEAMDAASINSSTISIRITSSGTAVGGSVSYDAATKSATFTPTAALSNATSYSAAVSTGVRDAAGNSLVSSASWSFTTESGVSALALTSTSPQNGAVNVPVTSKISAAFNKALDASTISASTFAVTITSSGGAVSGTRSYDVDAHTVTFTPSAGLLGNGISYTVRVTTGLHDTSGLGMGSDFVFSFTTVPDLTPPSVTQVSPANGAVNVGTGSVVSVKFSMAMTASTINGSTFTLSQGGSPVAGSVAYDGSNLTATFTPSAPLANSVTYSVNVSTDVTGTNGVSMSAPFSATFTTAAAAGPTDANINGYWTGSDDLGSVHWHITFAQNGSVLALTSNCIADICRVFPLDPAGTAAVGTGIPVDVTALNGSFTDPPITFTLTIANGRTFTFSGILTSTTSMRGTISGATLSSRPLTLNRAAVQP